RGWRGSLSGRATQTGADAREQFREGEWLDQVVIGAQVQTADHKLFFLATVPKQDYLGARANSLEHLQPGRAADVQAQDNQVRLCTREQLERGCRVAGNDCRHAGASQTVGQQLQQLRIG